MNAKPCVLCADDFSLNTPISAAIVDLLERGRLSATSCMTQSPLWRQHSVDLLPWRGRADLGLHFNLTHAFPDVACWPLPQLMLRAQLHRVPKRAVAERLRAQLDAFEDALGVRPDFIDGHQHVHLFPQIAELVIAECTRRYGTAPYIRSLEHLYAPGHVLKGTVLMAMGARWHGRRLRAAGLRSNTAFAGLYDFNPLAPFAELVRNWLNALPAGSLIMCHPAQEAEPDDAIGAARVMEYGFWGGAEFAEIVGASGVGLGRLDNVG